MPTLTGSRLWRTLTLCALYCAQGMPWGFVAITLVAYVNEQGVGIEESGKIVAMATLPWSFKVVWGVVIDRFTLRSMGRRRPWLLLAQLGIGTSLMAMILIDDLSAEVETLAWMVFLHNCFVSLQDVASDALAVEVLLPDERGRVNGLMWASNNLGSAIGGAGMGAVLGLYGLQAAFTLQISVLFAIVLFPLLIRERQGEKLLPWTAGEARMEEGEESTESFLELIRNLWGAFQNRAAAIGLLFSFAANFMIGVMVVVNPAYFVKVLEWTQVKYSGFTGGLGAIAGVAGALVGGLLVDRLGVRLIYSVSAAILVGLAAGLGLSEALRGSEAFCSTYLLLGLFLVSLQSVASFSMFMRLCAKVVAGTQFTLYMAISNLSRVVAAMAVGFIGEERYGPIFLVMGVSMLLSVPILFAIPQKERDDAAPQAA